MNNKNIEKNTHPTNNYRCSDPRNSDTDFGGFTMSKLTKKDKLNIYKE